MHYARTHINTKMHGKYINKQMAWRWGEAEPEEGGDKKNDQMKQERTIMSQKRTCALN